MPAKGLSTSVILFLSCSAVGFLVLILRRVFLKGELGGSTGVRYGTAFVFILLWLIYVLVAGMDVYGRFDDVTAKETVTNAFLKMKKAATGQ